MLCWWICTAWPKMKYDSWHSKTWCRLADTTGMLLQACQSITCFVFSGPIFLFSLFWELGIASIRPWSGIRILHAKTKLTSWPSSINAWKHPLDLHPSFGKKEHGNPRNKGSLFSAMCNIISLPAIGKKEHEGEISSLTVPKKGDF